MKPTNVCLATLLLSGCLFAPCMKVFAQSDDCAKLPKTPPKNFMITLYSRPSNKPEQVVRVDRDPRGQFELLTGSISNLLQRTGDTILSGFPIMKSDAQELFDSVVSDKAFCEHPEDFTASKSSSELDATKRFIVVYAGKKVRTIEIYGGRGTWANNLIALLTGYENRAH